MGEVGGKLGMEEDYLDRARRQSNLPSKFSLSSSPSASPAQHSSPHHGSSMLDTEGANGREEIMGQSGLHLTLWLLLDSSSHPLDPR